MKVTIVNTGVGNVKSVANMLRRVKNTDALEISISDDPDQILAADTLILPGVGSFDAAMIRLTDGGLIPPLNTAVQERGAAVLGLCLGMQLMTDGSDEGNEKGLGWIPGRFKRLKASTQGKTPIRVPHMGWNILSETKDCVLYENMGDEIRFYFDHSYVLQLEEPAYYCGKASHGIPFAAGIRSENIFGVQFHPEKSHRFGLALFENFLKYAAQCARKPMEALS
jgi:glutamine amidotransferase